MRKLAMLPLLLGVSLFASCANYTWRGQGADVTPEEREQGFVGVDKLAAAWERERTFKQARRGADGFVNSFGRDLDHILSTFSRHVLNYSETDPFVNYPTNSSLVGETLGFGMSTGVRLLPIR